MKRKLLTPSSLVANFRHSGVSSLKQNWIKLDWTTHCGQRIPRVTEIIFGQKRAYDPRGSHTYWQNASINHVVQLRGMQHAIITRKRAVAHTLQPKMDRRKNVRLMNPTAGNAGRSIIGKAYAAWVAIFTGPDRGKHCDMMQSNAQRRDNGLIRADADRQHDNDMCIKKRITPTQLHTY